MGQAQHQPLFENPKQGKLRTKVENGERVCPPAGLGWLQSSPLSLSGVPEFPYPSLWGAVVGFEAFRNQSGVGKRDGGVRGSPSSFPGLPVGLLREREYSWSVRSLAFLPSTLSVRFSHVKNDTSVIRTEFPFSRHLKMVPKPGDKADSGAHPTPARRR